MSRRSPFVIELSGVDRARLEAVARKQTAERRQVLRARIVLGAADGDENAAMAERFGVALNTVIKWRKRFFEGKHSGARRGGDEVKDTWRGSVVASS